MLLSCMHWSNMCLCLFIAPGLTGNAMDLLNYSAMNSWLSMFPFGMLPPNAMFNPMIPQQSVNNMAPKTQAANSLSSPPLLTSPSMESSAIVSRQHSVSSSNPSQVCTVILGMD